MSTYRLNKSRKILQSAYDWYKKKKDKMAPETVKNLEERMLGLEQAIKSDNREEASNLAKKLEEFSDVNFKKTFFEYCFEVVTAILIALILAVIVRQMWFELYEIPTGSMRPTFREQDHVTVTKTPFGINIPMTTGHFLFEPDLVHRIGVVTFTSEGIKDLDEDTMFMYVIPYKKRLIKRLMGKPGDILYFYGGKIYGVDKEGNPIEEYLQSPWLTNLEHIPFMSFAGSMTFPNHTEVIFHQMNEPIGKLTFKNSRDFVGEVFDGTKWIPDNPSAQKTPHNSIQSYSDFWGIRNFAMARLLTKSEMQEMGDVDLSSIPEGVLYLELRHTPSLTYPKPLIFKDMGYNLMLNPFRTYIPLQQHHLDALMDHMYTARLVFQNGRVARYSVDRSRFDQGSPSFPGVPDGTYEFYNGKIVKIGRGAITYEVEADNPLYSHDPKNVQKLFNLGIEVNTAFQPHGKYQLYYPSRYAYFRNGDLYLLGGSILKKDDPVLSEFNKKEETKEKNSTSEKPYIAFKDNGPPLKDGKYDIDFIRSFGLHIPEKQYLMLGDNHAMSSDSRAFGFVPEANLQGAPSLIIWPPGERWGVPSQKPYQLFNFPRMIVWSLVALSLLIWYLLHRRYLHRPITIK